MYDAVIFDNDGVLVSRTPYDVLQEATWAAFDAAGVDDPDPALVESLAVDVSPADVRAVCSRYGLDPEAFWARRDRLSAERQQAEARAGRKTPYEDVAALDRLSVPAGIVSSNQQSTVDFLVEYFGLGSYFGVAVGREPTLESLVRKKPAAYYLDRAVEALGAESPLFVGDNDSDVLAAANAGIDSAFIRRPHRRDHQPSPTPTHIVDDLHDVVGLCRPSTQSMTHD
ncbi:HAD family hydrolase [Halohasta salina]|uniref:HAD family hydrolase n=1 Tax=Halohasta salina TaxID=2961621 RepID=UPI0020A2498F|nr:HAD family hydrolase [Halohasta salina]